MKKLMNTLYVTSEDVFLGIEGENIIVKLPFRNCVPSKNEPINIHF